MLALARRRSAGLNVWPAFVDALASVLLVLVFMLLVFVLGQYLLSAKLTGRERALEELNRQVSALAERLGELSEELHAEQASRKETRAYLRGVDLTLSRLLDEVSGAREEVPEALRQEVRLLAQSLAQRPRARA